MGCSETTLNFTCEQKNQNENSDTAGESPEDMSASAAIPQRGASITHRKEAAREGGKGQTRESLLLRASSVCLNLGVLPPACLVDFLRECGMFAVPACLRRLC